MSGQTDSELALDWIVSWAMQNLDASGHFYNITDGIVDECGCQFQGEQSWSPIQGCDDPSPAGAPPESEVDQLEDK